MKKLLIILIICNPILSFGQNEFCHVLEKVDSLYCNNEWSAVISLLDEHEATLQQEVFYNEILVIKSWAFIQKNDLERAISALEQILKSQIFYNENTDFRIHSKCRSFNSKKQNGEYCYRIIGEPEQTVKYRALLLLADIAYNQQEYDKALNYLSITDKTYSYKPRENCHGCVEWQDKKKALLKSKIFEKTGNYEKSKAVILPFVLTETKPWDTLATYQLIQIYYKYYPNQQLQNDLLSLFDSLTVKVEVVKFDTYENMLYQDNWEILLSVSEYKKYGRVVYLTINDMKKPIYKHNDYAEYYNLKKRKRKFWQPKSNEELIESAKRELLFFNIYKRCFSN